MDNTHEKYIGCCCDMHRLQAMGADLSNKVLDKVNNTLELVMVNDFARETNENHFKKSLQDRMADIASWRWVFEDLTRRLEESKASLKYELKACKVVVERVKQEIEEHSKMATRPGVLSPKSDCVEKVILEEYEFLKEQKKTFEELCLVIEKQMASLDKTLDKIQNDILLKEKTIAIEAAMADYNMNNVNNVEFKTKRKKKPFSLDQWENKCHALKHEGLNALTNALLTKQQVRGARVQLTVAAQTLASKVEAAIRRRLHTNHTKLQELEWQKEEATKDLQALETEQMNTEQTLVANMDQERVIIARLADRSYRPEGEMTKDEVDYNLRAELGRVRWFIADLRSNLKEISHLQEKLQDTITKIDCYSVDLAQIIQLDEDRLNARQGNPPESYSSSINARQGNPPESYSSSTNARQGNPPESYSSSINARQGNPSESKVPQPTNIENPAEPNTLQTIKEEDEEIEEEIDDYPFSD